jgi:hypothetical protein
MRPAILASGRAQPFQRQHLMEAGDLGRSIGAIAVGGANRRYQAVALIELQGFGGDAELLGGFGRTEVDVLGGHGFGLS